ncbi:hypothetical protein [Aliivibrio kagoshimensis]
MKAINSPGDGTPSHGTHELAQTYAYDFVRIFPDKNGQDTFHSK